MRDAFLNTLSGQNLSFSSPVNIFPQANTSQSIDITQFKNHYFISWNDSRDGTIHVISIDSVSQQTSAAPHDLSIGDAHSNFAPVLRATPNYLYVFWMAKDGRIQYSFKDSDSSFANRPVHTLETLNPNPVSVSLGITAALAGNKIVITTHGTHKDELMYALVNIGREGLLEPALLRPVPAKSAGYPFVVALSDSTIRLTWRGYKDEGIYYADAAINSGAWTKTRQLYKAKTWASPAVYRVFGSNRLFFIWKGSKNDNKLYYTTEEEGQLSAKETELPSYFSTLYAVSICNVDRYRFILAYPGADGKLYLSYFTNYNPAKWMEESFYPRKASYTLKDIVIPGAHDAGMSVLSATGGQQSGTINECNTLTQFQNIKGQLNSGIRMFDLRVGMFNKLLYTKHCSSDCMADAIGGGYGERLGNILYSVKDFLQRNKKETILLTFSHFCEKEAPAAMVAKYIVDTLGTTFIWAGNGKRLDESRLEDLAGKAVVVFEQYAESSGLIDSCSIAPGSRCFINFRREYAATNVLANLETKEREFFSTMNSGRLSQNDLVRLDWQLTQSSDEAAMVCNDFQSENISPIINGAMSLTNAIRKHRSIKDLSMAGNRTLPVFVNARIADGTITKHNKPNILYVDVAGSWITDYCFQLNDHPLYTK